MNPAEPPLEGLTITALRTIPDERGAVLHMLRRHDAAFTAFGEVYFSEVLPGVVKGWKRHSRQTQNLTVPVGRIRLVVIEEPVGSQDPPRVRAMEVGRPDDYSLITIRPGLWYGFQALGEMPALVANCTDLPHDPTEGEQRALDDGPVDWRWSART